MDKEQRFENRQWNEAVHDARRAYKQFSDFEWKIDEDEPKRAAAHLRKALDSYNLAVTHIEKAIVGDSQKGAVDDMNRGITELSDAVTDLDNGEIDSAERHYGKAADDFDKVDAILS
jgi:hypothetical protein